jgi:hypothetical protein
MKDNGRMSTPRRRRKDREPVNPIAGTVVTVLAAMGDIPHAVADFTIEPTRENIAHRAYQLYEERGRQHGRDQEDWFRAEREVRQFLAETVGKSQATDSAYAAV